MLNRNESVFRSFSSYKKKKKISTKTKKNKNQEHNLYFLITVLRFTEFSTTVYAVTNIPTEY